VIVFQGRLVSTKGARVLLDAAKILCERGEEFSVVFIGDGPERAKLEAMATQPPLLGRVRFAGKLRQADLETELERATVVVVPSLGGEVFGMVVAENMQRGIPVMASDLGSFMEVIGDAGIAFHVGEARELAGNLQELLQSPPKGRKLGEKSKQRAETQFSLRMMISKHTMVYRQVSQTRPQQSGAR